MQDRAGEVIRKLRSGYRKRFGFTPGRPVVVQLYRGYRSSSSFFVEGRVLEQDGVNVLVTDRKWRNFINAIRRFESDEVAGAKVVLRFLGKSYEVVADDEGYIKCHAQLEAEATTGVWETIEADLLEVPFGKTPNSVFNGEIENLSVDKKVGIITDIDDTILKTHVTSLFKLRALYHTLVDNAHTRIAFAGAPELYTALQHGPNESAEHNPIFYLSRSPWNLYDMLVDFLEVKQFPKGPIFLRDVGLKYANTPLEGHKYEAIIRLLEDFPQMQFVLVGDSGEKDADIYKRVATSYPGRIRAIIIRNVKNNANARRIQRNFERVDSALEWHLVKDSVDAAKILNKLGLINEKQVRNVVDAVN